MRLYIAVVCKWQPTVLSYGEALADRIVSYREILSDIVSYLSFSLMAVSCHQYNTSTAATADLLIFNLLKINSHLLLLKNSHIKREW